VLLAFLQEPAAGFDWSTYGPTGIIAGLGIFFFFTAYKREKERADRLEAELREQNKLYREDIRAQLTRAIESISNERSR
jgi:hypothetical protein